MKVTNTSLKALSLSVAALALNAGVAHAGTIGIFGGGSTLSYALDDQAGQCAGVINSTKSGTPPAYNSDTLAAQQLGNCTNNAGYEYLFTGPGSGVALQALTTNFGAASQAGLVPYSKNFQDAGNGFGPYNATAGYPSWEISFSDAPVDTLDTINPATGLYKANTVTFGHEYLPAPVPAGDVPLSKYRGALWQIPVTATPVTLPYYLPSAAFGTTFYGPAQPTTSVTSGGHTATVTQLDLSTDMVCYIWTKETAKGATVSGSYTWDNPIFSGTTKKVATNITVTAFDSNLNASGVAGLAINPVVRSDASGTTYLFTLWLSKNCKGYTAAGWSTPAVLVTTPSFITSTGSGSGGMLTAVTKTLGGIGYITPDKVAPVSGSTPAAFLQIAYDLPAGSSMADFLYPSVANTQLAETGVALPTAQTYSLWGTALNTKFFKAAAVNNGYPIVGLTYVLGYSCYDNDSTNDEFDGVQNFLNFLGTADYQTLATGQGFAPLTQAQYQSAVAIVEAKMAGVSATPIVKTTGKVGTPSYKVTTTYGPAACPLFSSVAQDYK